MRFCTRCGQAVDDDLRFCTSCGQPLKPQQNSSANVAQPTPVPRPEPVGEPDYWDEMPPPAPKKKNNLLPALIIALAALLLAGIAIWWFLLRDSDKADDASGKETTEQTADAGADEAAAANVTFDHKSDGANEYGVITGTDDGGNVLWTVETPHFGVSQLQRVEGMEVRNGLYYYQEDGDIVALKLTDGSEAWRNTDFKGSFGDWEFDASGTVYLCGYLGPDLCSIDRDGNTLLRIAELDPAYYWPYRLAFVGENTLQIDYEMLEDYDGGGSITVNAGTGAVLSTEAGAASAVEPVPAAAAGAPTSATLSASSTLQEAGHDHSPRLAMDGSTSTAWVEGISGEGVGEWLRLDFGGDHTISGIQIWSGYQKTEALFYKNSRPRVIRIAYSDGRKFEATLNDQMGMQTIQLSAPVTTSSIMITIVSTYPGTTYSDVCISEVQFY